MNEQISQQTTPNNTSITTGEISKINVLEKEIELLKKIIEEKDEHNKSLKQAILMLEHKERQQAPHLNWLSRLFQIKK